LLSDDRCEFFSWALRRFCVPDDAPNRAARLAPKRLDVSHPLLGNLDPFDPSSLEELLSLGKYEALENTDQRSAILTIVALPYDEALLKDFLMHWGPEKLLIAAARRGREDLLNWALQNNLIDDIDDWGALVCSATLPWLVRNMPVHQWTRMRFENLMDAIATLAVSPLRDQVRFRPMHLQDALNNGNLERVKLIYEKQQSPIDCNQLSVQFIGSSDCLHWLIEHGWSTDGRAELVFLLAVCEARLGDALAALKSMQKQKRISLDAWQWSRAFGLLTAQAPQPNSNLHTLLAQLLKCSRCEIHQGCEKLHYLVRTEPALFALVMRSGSTLLIKRLLRIGGSCGAVDHTAEGARVFLAALDAMAERDAKAVLHCMGKHTLGDLWHQEWASAMGTHGTLRVFALIFDEFPWLCSKEFGDRISTGVRLHWFKSAEKVRFLLSRLALSRTETKQVLIDCSRDTALFAEVCTTIQRQGAMRTVIRNRILPTALLANDLELERLCTWHAYGFTVRIELDKRFRFRIQTRERELEFSWPRRALSNRDRAKHHCLVQQQDCRQPSLCPGLKHIFRWRGKGLHCVLYHLHRLTQGLEDYSEFNAEYELIFQARSFHGHAKRLIEAYCQAQEHRRSLLTQYI
jgi:hypothetical protein